MDTLLKKSLKKIRDIPDGFKRYLHREIDWTDRLIVIKGARGVGKTTLLLQHIKETHGLSDEVLYVSLDDIWFVDNRLTELAEQFVLEGGKYLYLDEVHKYPGWSQEIKNIYDDYPELNVVLTGSSALHIYSGQGDLSRRAVLYELYDLSLREFIAIKEGISLPVIKLEQILENHVDLAAEYSEHFRPIRLLKEYYNFGCYPYFIENRENYHQRLLNTINITLEVDLPAILGNINYSTIIKLKKLLYIIAHSVPFKPNITKLSHKIGVGRDTLLRYINHLAEARLIRLLHSNQKGIGYLTKPEKIYLANTNLIEALGEVESGKGTARETFFLNQLGTVANIHSHPETDFLVNDRFVFEVGGKSKTTHQIKGIDHAYVAADDLEIGYKNKIPLWLFGLLY